MDLIHSLDLTTHFTQRTAYPQSIALSPMGDRLVWTTQNAALYLYDVSSETVAQLESMLTHGGVADIYWHPIDDSLIAFIAGGSVHFYDFDVQERHGTMSTPIFGTVLDLAFSPDGSQIATSHMWRSTTADMRETGLAIWNLPPAGSIARTPIATVPDIGGLNLNWSPDGQRVAVIGNIGMGYSVYNVAQDKLEAANIGMNVDDSYSDIAWSPNGEYLATSGDLIHIWDATDFSLIGPYSSSLLSTGLVWPPDGKSIIADDFFSRGLISIKVDLPTNNQALTDDPD